MELPIQERLKDLRVERGLTMEQLAERTHLSKSALGSYEGTSSRISATMPLLNWQRFLEWLKRIAQKSDLLENPKPQRGRK